MAEFILGLECSSCGAGISPSAEQASRALERTSSTAQSALEVTYHVTTNELHLCAECFLAGYHLIA